MQAQLADIEYSDFSTSQDIVGGFMKIVPSDVDVSVPVACLVIWLLEDGGSNEKNCLSQWK